MAGFRTHNADSCQGLGLRSVSSHAPCPGLGDGVLQDLREPVRSLAFSNEDRICSFSRIQPSSSAMSQKNFQRRRDSSSRARRSAASWSEGKDRHCSVLKSKTCRVSGLLTGVADGEPGGVGADGLHAVGLDGMSASTRACFCSRSSTPSRLVSSRSRRAFSSSSRYSHSRTTFSFLAATRLMSWTAWTRSSYAVMSVSMASCFLPLVLAQPRLSHGRLPVEAPGELLQLLLTNQLHPQSQLPLMLRLLQYAPTPDGFLTLPMRFPSTFRAFILEK
ncbi:hypothetical protein F7725_012176 [Dissostichus mawsoni]|uniref:Uncharacterized protein n=1 Tax=Dissostichus mawsoni TaxID=36200 RepID=A0A7J5YLN4_DISMA|nr:hypothetical protein F7725_012176 [Dissostichus mawsoni]